jgi:hypothetical protein
MIPTINFISIEYLNMFLAGGYFTVSMRENFVFVGNGYVTS